MTPQTDLRFMALALALGRRGMGRVWPNPAVGCVLVNKGQIVGRGWTADGGRPHAEVRALAQAGPAAGGATAYVTLEPCSHQGQTPPCAQALIDAGVARVVIATGDPDPRVAGRGIGMLRDAGIIVDLGLCETLARKDHAGFLSRVTESRPFVTLKLAGTLDGRIATAAGESQWITGPEARRDVHMMRARHDAVMVGAGTARADDPSLTVRDLGIAGQPLRIVVSRNLDLPQSGQLAATARQVPLWLLHAPDAPTDRQAAWQARGAVLVPVAIGADGAIDMAAAMQSLGQAGLTCIFCEGGGALAASLLAGDLVDELVGFTAGLAIGAEGLPAIGAMGLATLQEAARFTLGETRRIGNDILHEWARHR